MCVCVCVCVCMCGGVSGVGVYVVGVSMVQVCVGGGVEEAIGAHTLWNKRALSSLGSKDSER